MSVHHWVHVISGIHADAWSAIAAWVTAVIAAVAGVFAFRQVREAKRLREEQAQPYVVAYMEPNQAAEYLIDFVVRNFGTTVARDVKLTSTPTLTRSVQGNAGHENVWVIETLPMLVPGQEWRTWWDSGHERINSGLPQRYEVMISYKDSRGKQMEPTKAILDWGTYTGRVYTEVYGVHRASKALVELAKTVSKFKEFGSSRLSVVVRNGDAADRRKRETYKRLEEQNRQQKESSQAPAQPHVESPQASAVPQVESSQTPAVPQQSPTHQGPEAHQQGTTQTPQP